MAGSATVLLLSANAKWIFASQVQGIRALVVFSLLYFFIYLLLRLEDKRASSWRGDELSRRGRGDVFHSQPPLVQFDTGRWRAGFRGCGMRMWSGFEIR